MMHEWVLKIMHLGWLAIPVPMYALYNKHYLDTKQAQLLIVQAAMLLSLMLPGWLMQAIRLVGSGFFVLITLDLCIIQYQQFLSRYELSAKEGRKTKKYQLLNGQPIFMVNSHHTLKKFKIKETFVIPLFVAIWLMLRIRFTKAVQFGIGHELADGVIFEGFLETLDGWNCNYAQFTYISAMWLCVLLYCYWFIFNVLMSSKLDTQLTEEQYIDENKYKIYLLKYLVIPSIIVMLVDVIYNLFAHVSCDGLIQCYDYFKYGILAHWIINWGVASSIGLFFYMKSGRFSVQSEPRNSSNSIQEMQRTLDQMLKHK